MFVKKSQSVSGNAIEFGEGTIGYNPGQLSIIGVSNKKPNPKRLKFKRIYQLGISVPDSGSSKESSSEKSV
jgi:hypothetical protein